MLLADDAADDHTITAYIGLTRGLYHRMGFPVCLLNQERFLALLKGEWEKHIDMAVDLARVVYREDE